MILWADEARRRGVGRRLLAATALAFTLAAAFLVAGCVTSQKACGVEVIEPQISENDPTLIDALVLVECDVAPSSHTIDVKIERDVGGLWRVVNLPTGGSTQCTDIPTPGNPVLCRRSVPCVDGYYRTVANIQYEGPNGPGGYIPDQEPENDIRCPV